MELLITVIVSLAITLAVALKNVKLNKEIVLLYLTINNLKIENNILKNRVEILEEIGNV
jgi:hypothetical protein